MHSSLQLDLLRSQQWLILGSSPHSRHLFNQLLNPGRPSKWHNLPSLSLLEHLPGLSSLSLHMLRLQQGQHQVNHTLLKLQHSLHTHNRGYGILCLFTRLILEWTTADAHSCLLQSYLGTVTALIPPNYGIIDGNAFYVNEIVVGRIPQVRLLHECMAQHRKTQNPSCAAAYLQGIQA